MTWFRAIAAIEIFGGLSGPILLAFQLKQAPLSLATLGLASLVLGLYLLSFAGGILLWRGKQLGRYLSVLLQIIQLPKYSSSSLVFMMSFGFDLALLGVSSSGPSGYGLGLDTKLGGNHTLFVGNPGMPSAIGVSIVSCILLVKLLTGRPAPNALQQTAQADGPASGGPAA